jgi:hypothetical protein
LFVDLVFNCFVAMMEMANVLGVCSAVQRILFGHPFFEDVKYSSEETGAITAKCCKCSSKRVFVANLKATTNLTKHLQTQHPDLHALYIKKKDEEQENRVKGFQGSKKRSADNDQKSMSLTKFFKPNNSSIDKVRMLVTNYVAASMVPISTVDNKDFKDMLNGEP